MAETEALPDSEAPDADGGGDGGTPHWQRTLYACWVAQLLSIVGFSFVSPFIPFFIREELGVSGDANVAMWAGIIVFAAGITQAAFAPIWGSLSDRYGRKIMVKRSMFGGAVVLSLMGLAGSVYQLMMLRALQGALTGTVVATTTLVASVTPHNRMGYSLGMMQVAVLSGMMVGPLAGGMMADAMGYRMPFMVSGITLLLGGLIVQFLVKENFTPPDRENAPNHGLQRAFGRRGVTALLVSFFMISLAGSFVGPIFPLLVEEVSGSARVATTSGLLLGASGLAAGLSALAIGLLGDRWGHKAVLVACTVGAAIFAAPHAIAHTVGQLLVLRIGTGAMRGGTAPTQNAIIGQAVSSDTYGRAFGTTRVAGALGMAFGPLMGGFTAAHYGLRVPYVIMAGLLILSAILVAAWIRPAVAHAVEQNELNKPESFAAK